MNFLMMHYVKCRSLKCLFTRSTLYYLFQRYDFIVNLLAMGCIISPTRYCYFTFFALKLFQCKFIIMPVNMCFEIFFIEINFWTLGTQVLFLINEFRWDPIMLSSVISCRFFLVQIYLSKHDTSVQTRFRINNFLCLITLFFRFE